MAQEQPQFDYYEETQSEKLARKSKESPFMIIGLGGFAAAVGYGVYSYKKRSHDAVSTGVLIMKFRVIAQGIAVSALTAGMAYTLYQNHFANKKSSAGSSSALQKPNHH